MKFLLDTKASLEKPLVLSPDMVMEFLDKYLLIS